MAKREVVKKDIAPKEIVVKDAAVKTTRKSATKKEPAETAPAETPVVKKAAIPLLTTTDISEHLATMFEIPKSHAKGYLVESIAMIGKHLKKGGKVRISGLGIFQVKKRGARKGRNPNTGASIKIKAIKRVAFAAARDLKAKL